MTGVAEEATSVPSVVDSKSLGVDLPRVSCIMPTRNRRHFVPQAIRYFQRQDYPDLELIVVDDGDDDVRDLIPIDSRINYVRLQGTYSIGAKRNIACGRATGDIIAHWDDDDWSAPSRIRRQVVALREADADVCGISTLLHYRVLHGDGWLYHGNGSGEKLVPGCSIIYRRSMWADNAFAEVNVGEDSAFVARVGAKRLCVLKDSGLMIAVVHGRNVSTLALGTAQWQPAPLDTIAELLGRDRPFYTLLRGGRIDVTPQSAATSITIAAGFDVHSGYGTTAEYLVLSLARAGAKVRALPLSLSTPGLTEELLSIIDDTGTAADDAPTIYYSPLWRAPTVQRDLFISTMWEANRFPSTWVPVMQKAKALIVPSTFVADSCRASGVTKPVYVVPQGVDPDLYYWQPRPQREGLVTLIVAPVDGRKHTEMAIAAWKTAFQDDPSARLIIKTTYGYHNFVPDDRRISYVDRVETTRGIADWYRQADVLLALGNEGFGLPLLEGMATGLPVIALDSEGQADICSEAPDLVLRVPPVGLEPHIYHNYGPAGERSIPDFESVVRQLRWVKEHGEEASELGRAAASWAVANRNVWSVGPAVLDIVGTASARPLRRPSRRTLWVSTAGTACGIAEYSEQLRQRIPSVHLTATEPKLREPETIHIQHEPAIMDDLRLERFACLAKDRGVAVAVTEHSVFEHSSPWEQHVRALVTTTRVGAARLKRRNPGVAVVHIPLGCPTWSFPRKSRRARTIGLFGFPWAHKGFERLAAALRRVHGCEVVLYSHHTEREPYPVDWPDGVPVRWENSWLPTAQIAARLAAEADVLVFHYDEVAHASASSAALLGLSTGVPVLTSPTVWFDDVGPAVHRRSDLATGLEELLDDDELRDRTTAAAREYCLAHSWNHIAARHVALWNSLETV
jgi:glycosyltransferase involved in cell wall biosynthesis